MVSGPTVAGSATLADDGTAAIVAETAGPHNTVQLRANVRLTTSDIVVTGYYHGYVGTRDAAYCTQDADAHSRL
jgi:hypothetical protein